MALPDIDFSRIRPHDGSQHIGFEELVTQLASLERRPAGSTFVRKGRGGDGGIECFVTLANGDEYGWQAKYVFSWDASLETQLNTSLEAALAKHPRLTKLTVCIPFDLPDGRPNQGNHATQKKSARQKWDTWKSGWEQHAAVQQRTLTISLWDSGVLSGRLTTDSPAYNGRLLYWFGTTTLTSAWFTEQFGKMREALGSRYTPDTNVELPIRKTFLAFARDPSINDTVLEWSLSLGDRGRSAIEAIERALGKNNQPKELSALSAALTSLSQALDVGPVGPEAQLPLDAWQKASRACSSAFYNALEWVYTLPASKADPGVTREDWARHELFRLIDIVRDIEAALDSDDWQFANAHAVLLEGEAGTGKSHLLADVVEHQIHANRPALLVLGGALVEGEPWKQIMAQLDLAPDLQAKHFLGSLDAAGQAAGVRTIICIDAINERHGTDIWPDRLAAFLKMAEPFPHVSIVLSCRSTYVRHVVPDSLDEKRLPRVLHQGFAVRGGEAANMYLAKRGVVRPGAPALVPEFQNPLFLKTCCDFLEKVGKNELPRGLRGVSAIFNFYNNAVIRAITQRMKLDPHLDLVATALTLLTDILISRGEGYAPKTEVIGAFEAVLPSGGSLERSLLSQFESEGVLAIELIREDDGKIVPMVRFTFERYSDHAIAARLLQEHLNQDDVKASFADSTVLGDLAFGEKHYRVAGIIEAIAIQLPEHCGVEIVDLRPEFNWMIRQAFFDSLLWREQRFFSDRTFKCLRGLENNERVSDVLISIATEPENKFNALYIHKRLSSLSMPERDASWSVYLNNRGSEGDPVEVLINWAIQNGMGTIDNGRAELAAITLSWFLTTSHRAVRDKTTKALASLFAMRLTLAASTLRLFSEANDLYLRERLFAAAYGAALQGKTVDGLSELAATTYELVFAAGAPPLNELLRDHARGIITYAQFRKQLPPSVDLTKAHPPHKSQWPIEYVSEEKIDSYQQDHGDAIVSSAVNDGDFARYVIDHTIDNWAPVSIDAKDCPSAHSLGSEWIERFTVQAGAEQLAAFELVADAANACGGDLSYKETPERTALKAAENTFQAVLSPEAWEEYRVKAQDFVRYSMFSRQPYDYPARFNRGWGRRWICMRAHELGWTQERFAKLERGYSGDRYEHRVERIGKKYQWLALHELVARMADNLLFMGQSYGDECRTYEGVRDIRLRDIDPSLLVTKTYYDNWKQWDQTWWIPVQPRLRPIAPLERLAWLDSQIDLLNDASFIDLTDPKTNRHWLTLSSFASWRQYGLDGGNKSMQRETWYRVRCVVVAKNDEASAVKSLSGRNLVHPDSLPEFHLDSSYFLGEYPWHPKLQDQDDWVGGSHWNGLSVSVRPTCAHYLSERGGYDYSIDETVRIELPAPWLAKEMGLRLQDGQKPTFVDVDGEICFFDPSVIEPGYQAALVDRDAFLAMLDRKGLAAIWVVAGEKGVFGGKDGYGGFGGRVLHTTVYTLGENGFKKNQYRSREKPSPEQLEKLLEDKPTEELLLLHAKK
ncbi:hypothetical protein [Advenella mimigardefordensis]|uniref:ATP-binding protein n=1 Tax=Advenella mimigardefordensis (strain DSM 17166 / LMG 22922 / DPN7) TaxID=1247726 RepID=W0PIQ3_ADVMD|nr:hypothetical protein [Advenella mimigardefordensis]AHG65395.1 hypothetical protein MIM_c33340 [Advenella mimigardefordensis DPN7]